MISAIALCGFAWGCKHPDLDIVIKNGKIIDGTGNPPYYADVGIRGDIIAAIGDLQSERAGKIIDAAGLSVCPGFIDIHTHCDRGLGNPETAANINFLSQGVTTVVGGNCGSGSLDIAAKKAQWEEQGIGTNAVLLAGLGTFRTAVMGTEERAASAGEFERMKSLLRQAMQEGAGGLSVALQYIPDRFHKTEEVIELSRVVGEFGGVLNSHQRSEQAGLIEAVRETIRVAEETGVRVNATHLKASGKNNWGLLEESISLIEEARSRGIPITADLYTYPQCVYSPLATVFNVPDDLSPLQELVEMTDYHYVHSRLGVTIEDWVKRGKKSPLARPELLDKYVDALSRALADPTKRERICRLTMEGAPDKLNWVPMFGWDSFTIVESPRHPEFVGLTIAEISSDQKREPFDVAAGLLIEEKNDLVISVFTMSEDGISRALRREWMMVGSDAGASAVKPGAKGHPGTFGTFARIFRKYVREEGLLTLEEAVKKLSFLPARFLGLKRRGILRRGYKADIVVFSPETIRDHSSYADAHRLCTGISHVLVNGKLSIHEGCFNHRPNGRVLLLDHDEMEVPGLRRTGLKRTSCAR